MWQRVISGLGGESCVCLTLNVRIWYFIITQHDAVMAMVCLYVCVYVVHYHGLDHVSEYVITSNHSPSKS